MPKYEDQEEELDTYGEEGKLSITAVDKPKVRRNKSVREKIAEHFWGYTSKRTKNVHQVPHGYTIGHSKNGHPYLQRVADRADPEAANEHKRLNIPLSADRYELGNRFGVGIYLYFDFMLFLILTNLLLFGLGVTNFAIHMDRDDVTDAGDTPIDRARHYPFYGTYGDSSQMVWRYTTIGSILLWFLFGPIYSIRVTNYFRREQIEDIDETLFVAEDYIKENERFSRTQRTTRIVGSYIIFLLVLAISSVVSFFLVLVSVSTSNADKDLKSVLMAITIACFLKFINMCWQRLCVILTRMEGHRTWSQFRNHNVIKFFFFKLLNVLVMYGGRVIVPRVCPHLPKVSRYCSSAIAAAGDSSSSDQAGYSACSYDTVGQQFFWLLVLDLTLQNAWEVGNAWLRDQWAKKKGMMGTGSNDSVRPDFDLAEEYLEVIYRQFIIYLATPIFPLVAILGVFCNLMEYYVDKYRLLRICKHPRGLQGSMKHFLTFFLFLTAAAALASPPYGAIWVILGKSEDICMGDI